MNGQRPFKDGASVKSGEFAQHSIHEGHVIQTREPVKIEDNSQDLNELDSMNNMSLEDSGRNRGSSMITPSRRDKNKNRRGSGKLDGDAKIIKL
jgi:hypothetical protein